MRVNVYAEEMTGQVEIISKQIDGRTFTGCRIYLHLPVTMPDGSQAKGPFMHHPGDDDSSAVTFWGKRDLRQVFKRALALLDEHYSEVAVADDMGGDSIGTALPAEIARVRDEVIPAYESIGTAGAPALVFIRRDLAAAEKALAEGDAVAMIAAYKALEGVR